MTSDLVLGEDILRDSDVILGYPTSRHIQSIRLTIGPHARIRSGSVIYVGSRLGSHLETGHHVIIREENTVGDRLRIWSNSVIDFGCTIGDGVRIHNNVYVAQWTVLEDGVFLGPGVSLANDMYPGQKWKPPWQGPIIKRGAQIGVNSTILPGVVIGEGSLIGSGSVVTRDIPAGMLAYGNPARTIMTVEELQARRNRSDEIA